jgi:hypothetical protein
MSLDELLAAANQLSENDLEQLLQEVAALRAQRRAYVLPASEAQLLNKINQGIPTELRTQYQTLRAKLEAETLTEQEHPLSNSATLSNRLALNA